MPQIVNNKTGFVANASDADWSNNVYDKNVWAVQGSTPAPAPTPTPAPTPAPTPTAIPTTKDLTTPTTPPAGAAKMGTFVTVDATGKPISGSRTALEVGKQTSNQQLEVAIPHPDLIDQYYVTNKSGNTLYGIKKTVAPAPSGSASSPTGETPAPTIQAQPTIDEQMDALMGALDDKNSPYQAQLDQANAQANSVKAELDKMKSEIDLNNVLDTQTQAQMKQSYYGNKEAIEDQPIPMTEINKQLGVLTEQVNEGLDKMNIQSMVTEALNVYKYNTKLIEYNALTGKANAAQQMIQQNAQNFFQFQTLRLNLLERRDRIDIATRDSLYKQAEYELNLSESGYTPISAANYEQMVRRYGENQIWKDPVSGRAYLKPQTSPEEEAIINGWIAKYADVNISPTDTLDQARAKIVNSKYFKQETRLSGGGGGTPKGSFKVGSEVIEETGDTFQDTVNYLISLRNQGMLTDYAYEEKITALMQNVDADPSRRGEIESMVNSAMEGGTVEDISEQVVDSWVSDEPTKTYAEQGLGFIGTDAKTYGKELVNVTGVPSLLEKAGNFGKKAAKYITGK